MKGVQLPKLPQKLIRRSVGFAGRLSQGYLLLLLIAAWVVPYFLPLSAFEQQVNRLFQGPTWSHPMGTDELGRDVWTRFLIGTRFTLSAALLSTLICLIVGVSFGTFSAWRGGTVDRWMVRLLDLLSSIPQLLLMILFKVFFDAFSFIPDEVFRAFIGTVLALSLDGWMIFARMSRAQVAKIKLEPFVEAAHAMGASHFRILFFHVLRQAVGPLTALFILQLPSNILYESFLSFLGLGLKPPMSSWGILMASSFESLSYAPHLILLPGLFMVLAFLSLNHLSERLQNRFQ